MSGTLLCRSLDSGRREISFWIDIAFVGGLCNNGSLSYVTEKIEIIEINE